MLASILNILVLAASVVAVTKLLPGIRCKSFGTAVMVALGISVLNFVAFKLLIFLALPFMLLTGFLGYFIINGLILYAVDQMVDDFEVKGMGNLLLGSTLISVVNWFLSHVLGRFLHI
jgi:putative membrane protein